MRVLVAGATGAIGRVLVPKLLAGGHEVVGSTRSGDRAGVVRAMGAEPVVFDGLDADAVRAAVADARPDGVVHELTNLPARLDPRKYKTHLAATNRLRREGTRNLVTAAQAAGVEKILAQSIAFVYAPTGEWVKDEQAPLAVESPAPMNEAVEAVAALEQTVLAVGGIVLRYGYFYGPGTGFARDGHYAELARRRRFPVVGSGEGRWSFIHVEDAAVATVAALEQGQPGVYNICDDEPAPVSQWLAVFAAEVGAKPPMRVPAWVGRIFGGRAGVSAMTVQRGASNAKAKDELGWTPRFATWREGFREGLGT